VLLEDELVRENLLNILLEDAEALCDHAAVVLGSLW
jgi:hypothetical protein